MAWKAVVVLTELVMISIVVRLMRSDKLGVCDSGVGSVWIGQHLGSREV